MAGAPMTAVENAMRSIDKVQTYIGHGMDDVIDVALDLAEEESDGKQLKELQQVMLDYAKIEHDLKVFTQTVENVKTQMRHADPSNMPDMEKLLDEQLKEQRKKDKEESNDKGAIFERHEKVKELKDKLWEIQNPGESMPTQATEQTLGDDEDMVMTQAETITKCPITLQDMKDPVKNKHCGHSYDKDAISQMLQNKRPMKCPVGGCKNSKHINSKDLEDNKELKKFIERKNRAANKKRTK